MKEQGHPPTPLFQAVHADRYERQRLIREYQDTYDCRLIVVVDAIFPDSVTGLEELIFDADPDQDLHMLLASPGGDGEIAVRMARSIQARCREFTVIVPDEAKSAATLLAFGAHHILMGPTSDLGPIDPQMRLTADSGLVAAKDIVAAVEDAVAKVQKAPSTFPVYASLLADVTAIKVQQAKAGLARTGKLLDLALRTNPDRRETQCRTLKRMLTAELVTKADYHAAIFGAAEAEKAGLPVIQADPQGAQWQLIWRLWAKYFVQGPDLHAYEGERASNVHVHH
jgi:hypothetical protein